MEAFDRLCFYQNYRQPYTVIPITTVRGPYEATKPTFNEGPSSAHQRSAI